MLRIVAIISVLMLAAAPVAGKGDDWSGQYAVEGENAYASQYQGVVTVTATGETFEVVWEIGGDVIGGTAIARGGLLSVGYDGGVAVYERGDDGAIHGVWSESGGQTLSVEVWR